MPKTTAITIILVFVLLISGGIGFWYYKVAKNYGAVNLPENQSESGGEFFPFGDTAASNNTSSQQNNNTGEDNAQINGEVPLAREISSSATSGFGLSNNKFDGEVVRYIERETGNIFEAPLNIMTKRRLTNNNIPKVSESLWLPGGSGLIARYLAENDSIETYSAKITLSASSTEEGRAEGKFLPRNITSLSLVSSSIATTSKNPFRIFYITEGDSVSGFIANSDGEKASKVFDSTIHEWLSYPINEQNVLLSTKPSGESAGYLFLLNTRVGSLTKILGGYNGLRVLPNKSGDRIIFSETGSGIPRLFIFSTKDKKISPLGLFGLADKCTWDEINKNRFICAVPKNFDKTLLYPDVWYQGKLSFSDNLWEVSLPNLETKEVFDTDKNSLFLDIDDISYNYDGKFAIVRNKTDGTLWSLKLSR